MENPKFTFGVPSGIGDISWLYSKLVNLKSSFALEICGNLPRRSKEFAEILPKVENSFYEDFSYRETFVVSDKGISPSTDLEILPPGKYYLSANRFLESGNKLERFLPFLPINYRYEINTQGAKDFLEGLNPPFVGVYCSKYENYKNEWKFLSADEWGVLLKIIYSLFPCTFVFIGASFDVGLGDEVFNKLNLPAINLIGKTHIKDIVFMMKKFSYLFAYPSGIGVLGDVVDIPTMHFLPTPRLDNLKDTYADPKNIESGKHLNVMFTSVKNVIDIFTLKGLPLCC